MEKRSFFTDCTIKAEVAHPGFKADATSDHADVFPVIKTGTALTLDLFSVGGEREKSNYQCRIELDSEFGVTGMFSTVL